MRLVGSTLLILLIAAPAAGYAPDVEPRPDSPIVRAVDLCRAATTPATGPICEDLVLAILTDDADLFLTYVQAGEGFTLQRCGVETPIRGDGMLRAFIDDAGGLRGLLGLGQRGTTVDLRVQDCGECRTPHFEIRAIGANGAVADIEVYDGRVRYVRLSTLVSQTWSGEGADFWAVAGLPDDSSL